MSSFLRWFAALACLSLILVFAAGENFSEDARRQLAGLFFVESVKTTHLKNAYRATRDGEKKIKILIVPGHDPSASGGAYQEMREVELTLEIGEYLATLLKHEKAFDVTLAQTRAGFFPPLAHFFTKERDPILTFRTERKILMDAGIRASMVDVRHGIVHNHAPAETVVKLYGINKWANENRVDIVIHLHFNDDPERRRGMPGIYTGFAIYVPEKQYSNAGASRAVAEALHKRLAKELAQSDLPLERGGIIESQDLIAVGAYNTLDSAGILIEYGYIYEPQLVAEEVRPLALKAAAYATYSGILDFFGEQSPQARSPLFPSAFPRDLAHGERGKKDVFILQQALREEGVFPPPGTSLEECPASGNFLSCTEQAVRAFQKKYAITPASGRVGPRTRAKLVELYGDSSPPQ